MAQASLTKSRPRLPVGSKNIGLPAIEIARNKDVPKASPSSARWF